MAADSVHLGGEFRPTKAVPLPQIIDEPGLVPCPCPDKLLLQIHLGNSATLPFLGLDPRFPEHLATAEMTIERIQDFDADPRILVVFAHDTTIFDVLEYYPKIANEWRAKDWKKTGRWRFLVDLQKIARDQAMD